MWDNIRISNIHVIGVPGEESENGASNIFEEITVRCKWTYLKSSVNTKQNSYKENHI